MSKYPVTNAQYAAFLNGVGVDNSGAKAEIQGGKQLIRTSDGTGYDWGLHYNSGQWEPVATYENHPVVFVSWDGAKAYVEWAGGDLPTEAQWERAARGGIENMPFGLGSGNLLTDAMANFDGRHPYDSNSNGEYSAPSGTYLRYTTAVGSYPANAYGLYDMHGNVREWCLDWYNATYYASSPVTDPENAVPGLNRVLRGGYWGNYSGSCRSAYRVFAPAGESSSIASFRVMFFP
jgi:formylglycine-generating enzyme required for sulfatase activity